MHRFALALALLASLAFVSLAACNGGGEAERADFYESCVSAEECLSAAEACYEIAWLTGRGGMCSLTCETNADCPGDAACWELEGDPMAGQRICYQRCVSDFDCAPGFLCADAVMDMTVVDAICLPR